MKTRSFGRTGWQVSEIGFGAWQIGADWGNVAEDEARATLHAALDAGITLIDTADVYGDGRSETIIGQILKERGPDGVRVLTKAGRRLKPHEAAGYTAANLAAFVDRSLKNLQTDALDLVQLHCPPTAVYYRPEVFGALDDLVAVGKLRAYGVSVEKVEEAIKAIEYPNVSSVQIIFNMFRQRPAGLFFDLAQQRKVAVVARVPLASGLLSGKIGRETRFAPNDHRNFNIQGAAFDIGETFAGVPLEAGLRAVDRLKATLPDKVPLAQMALRWILMFDAVSVVIPGARTPDQARSNAAASDLPPLGPDEMDAVRRIYEEEIKSSVHQRW